MVHQSWLPVLPYVSQNAGYLAEKRCSCLVFHREDVTSTKTSQLRGLRVRWEADGQGQNILGLSLVGGD